MVQLAAITAAGGAWVGASGSAPVHLTRRGYTAVLVAVVGAVLALALVVLRIPGAGALGEVRPAPVAAGVSVVVQAGDSLWGIAESVRPEDDPRAVVEQIQRANGLRSNVIQPGQVLVVPVAG